MHLSRRISPVPRGQSSKLGTFGVPARCPQTAGVLLALAVCLGSALSLCSTAMAVPITVNLRVEGSVKTLFEGPIATAGETIEAPASKGAHPCNYAENGSSTSEFADGGNASGTPTTALHDAAIGRGLAFNAEWFGNESHGGNPGDFFVTQVGPDIEGGTPVESWGYAVDDTTAPVGGCEIALAPGSEVLWAYNYFNLTHLLSLSGPSSANAGAPFVVHVTDGQTGEAIAGAAIGEVNAGVTTTIPASPVTNASGNATISLSHTGSVMLKATRVDSVRSNGLVVCLHVGSDGSCGTTMSGANGSSTSVNLSTGSATAELARILGIKSGHVYARRFAPRVLRGVITITAGGTLHQVRIRLERHYGRHCFDFSGSREQFGRPSKCGSASFFSVGGAESFSYLLPAPLPPGRYVYDIEAVDGAGQVTKLIGGVSHVVFRVK